MSSYNKQQKSNNWINTQQANTYNDGFTVVKSKKNVKDNNTYNKSYHSQTPQQQPQPVANTWNNNHNNRGSRNSNRSNQNNNYSTTKSYQPPQQQSSNKKQTKKLSYEEQFPSITNTSTPTHNNSTIRSNSPISHTPINNLNFKIAIDKPVSNIISSSSSIKKTTNQDIEEKETFDLSLYVKLQERRQKEYDSLYGEGAFVSDRLNYERYASEHESDDDGEDINGMDAEDSVEVFEFDY